MAHLWRTAQARSKVRGYVARSKNAVEQLREAGGFGMSATGATYSPELIELMKTIFVRRCGRNSRSEAQIGHDGRNRVAYPRVRRQRRARPSGAPECGTLRRR
jgi:hypothetical protein